MNEFIGLGPVEKRDPGAHIADPRGIIREHSNGLSKREWFAGLAMQAMLVSATPNKVELAGEDTVMVSVDYDAIAIAAKRYADALIKELAK